MTTPRLSIIKDKLRHSVELQKQLIERQNIAIEDFGEGEGERDPVISREDESEG